MRKIKEADLPIKGIKLTIYDGVVVVHSKGRLKVLSSAVLNGGIRETHHLLNIQVSSSYNSEHPEEDIRKIESELEIADSVGMMTAASVEDVVIKYDDGVLVLITAGTSNSAGPGEAALPKKVGTVNIFLILDRHLEEEAFVNAVITATEAKTLAFMDLDIRSSNSGRVATGTTTDSIAIGSSCRGETVRYLSTATSLGKKIGKLVYEGVYEAIVRQDKISPSRSIYDRLKERGIFIEEIVEEGTRILEKEGIFLPDKYKGFFSDDFYKMMDDVNIAALIMAGIRIYEDDRRGLIPNISSQNHDGDYPITLVVGEMLGEAIAKYVGGTLVADEYKRIAKSQIMTINELDPILYGAFLGLTVGVSSRLLHGDAG